MEYPLCFKKINENVLFFQLLITCFDIESAFDGLPKMIFPSEN